MKKELDTLKKHEVLYKSKLTEFENSLKSTEQYLAAVEKQEGDAVRAREKITQDREYLEKETADKLAEIDAQEQEIALLKSILASEMARSKEKESLLRELQQRRKAFKMQVEEASKYSSIAFNNSHMDEI